MKEQWGDDVENDEEWYVFEDSEQKGPWDLNTIKKKIFSGQIKNSAYLFQVGWKDWRPLDQCTADLQMPIPVASRPPTERAPRAALRGRIILHDQTALLMSRGVNISPTGIFVETKDQIFSLGTKVKLTCQVEDASIDPFHVEAMVIRSSKEPTSGYGLKFTSIDKKTVSQIQDYVNLINQNTKTA